GVGRLPGRSRSPRPGRTLSERLHAARAWMSRGPQTWAGLSAKRSATSQHARLESACAALDAPLAAVDVDPLDANRDHLARRAAPGGGPLAWRASGSAVERCCAVRSTAARHFGACWR